MAVDAGSIYSEVRVRLDKLKGDISAIEKEFDKFGETNKTQSTKVEQDWTKGFNAASLAGVAAFAAIGVAIKQSISIFAEYDSAMGALNATMQGSEQDFADLEAAALKVGSTTEWSAKQAADALLILAQQGKTAAESVTLLGQAQLLAGSTGTGLADSTKLLVNLMAQFKIGTEDANRVVEVLASARMPLESFGSALASLGPAASAMGIPIENIVAVIKLLSKSGIEASSATMALRMVMGELSDENSAVVKTLGQLGITYDKINPKTNDFADIITHLQERGLAADEALAVFGNRAGPVMTELMAQGGDAIAAYTAEITGTSEAADMWAKRNDTLQDKLSTINNALEVAAITTAKEFSPVMKGVLDIATGLINTFTALPAPFKIFFGVAAVGITAVIGLTTAFKLLSGALAGSAGVISLVVGGIAAAVALASALPHWLDPVVIAQDKAKEAHNDLQAATEQLNSALDELNEIQKKLKTSTNDMTTAEKNNLKAREDRLKLDVVAGLSAQVDAVNKLNKVYNENKNVMDDILKRQAAEDQYAQRLIEGGFIEAEAKGLAADKTRELSAAYGVLKETQKGLTTDMAAGVKTLAEHVRAGLIDEAMIYKLSEAVGKLVTDQIKLIETQEKDAKQKAKDAEADTKRNDERLERDRKYKLQVDLVNQTLDAQKTTVDKLRETLKRLESQQLRGADETARQKAILEVKKQITEEEKKLFEAQKKGATVSDEYRKKLEELNQAELEAIESERQAAIEALEGMDKRSLAYLEAISAINNYYDELSDQKKQEKVKKAFKETFDSVVDIASQAFAAIGNLSNALAEKQIAALDEELQAELQAAGVAEESAVEQAQRELAEATKTKDKELILEKSKALQKAQIEEAYEKKKAKLQYDAALFQWGLTLAQTIADAAAAVIKVFPNIPLMVAAGIIGGIAIGAVAVAKPEPSGFEEGGLVIGPQGRDRVNAKLTAGEMVLTKEQQARLFDMANGRASASAPVFITIQSVLDGMVVAENSAKYYNANTVRLDR
jgi:TP901 family phage tail tape measure protein